MSEILAEEMNYWQTGRSAPDIWNVRVERLQDIGEEDAIAEGIELMGLLWRDYSGHFAEDVGFYQPIDSFRSLWDSINAKRGYGLDANPFVWVIEFRRINVKSSSQES